MPTATNKQKSLGQIAYEGYWYDADGTGIKPTPFDLLATGAKVAWETAAEFVIEEMSQRMNREANRPIEITPTNLNT